jgi:hypothetical protein
MGSERKNEKEATPFKAEMEMTDHVICLSSNNHYIIPYVAAANLSHIDLMFQSLK